jgi:biopolymer transport protein ExbB/TolQ
MARAFVPFLAVLALVLSGCGEPTAESVTEDMLGKMKEMVTVLKGITDEASAKAAKPKLEQIKKDMDGLEAQAQKVEKETSAEEREKIKNKYEPELEKVMGEVFTEMGRIATIPNVGPMLGDIMPKD